VNLGIGPGKQKVRQVGSDKTGPAKNGHGAAFLLPHGSPFQVICA
jgi:hypothetical protein